LDPEDIRKLNKGPSGNLLKEQGSSNLVTEYGAQRACPKAYVHRARKGSNPNTIQFNSFKCLENVQIKLLTF
jgi:hypothetical protein